MATRIRIQPKSLQRLSNIYRRSPDVLYRRLNGAMRQSGVEWEREMAKRTKGQTRSDGLGRRTGALARSISTHLTGSQPDISSIKLRAVSAGVSYAPVHEFGATIRPKNAQNLTIPIADNLTKGGDVRYPSARALFSSKTAGRQPFFFESGGKTFIGLRESGQKGFKLLFVLKKQVTIPARLGFMDTWRKFAGKRNARFRRALATTLREARG